MKKGIIRKAVEIIIEFMTKIILIIYVGIEMIFLLFQLRKEKENEK